MKTSLMCMECNIKQIIKLSNLLKIDKQKQEEAFKQIFSKLSKISFDLTNPEIMGTITWPIITKVFNNDNPYKEIKIMYNKLLYNLYNDFEETVNKSKDKIDTALKLAVIGNLIDFGARHEFSKEEVLESTKNVESLTFKIDDRKSFRKQLKTAKRLLYIGDNCGEIVLDRLFIQTIKKEHPDLEIYFGVREAPVLNDVTEEDAYQVKMQEVAKIIKSGVAYPGTVLSASSKEFADVFNNSDIVIAKGQGNFESLSDIKRKGLFLILIVKCSYIAEVANTEVMDYIIKENK